MSQLVGTTQVLIVHQNFFASHFYVKSILAKCRVPKAKTWHFDRFTGNEDWFLVNFSSDRMQYSLKSEMLKVSKQQILRLQTHRKCFHVNFGWQENCQISALCHRDSHTNFVVNDLIRILNLVFQNLGSIFPFHLQKTPKTPL